MLVPAATQSVLVDDLAFWFANIPEPELLDRGSDRLCTYDRPPRRIARLGGRSVLRRIPILVVVPRARIGVFLQAAFAGLVHRGGRASVRRIGSVHPLSGAAHEPRDQPARLRDGPHAL